MGSRHFILATAGHVDHGKSALVRALTGTDPDRLPEERRRGITIDLGFAHLTVPSLADPEVIYQVGVVDVPGHEDFIKNMVAGVGATDVALLVVAADDGWMPQTEEHLQILEYLGVSRAVVALTKSDLAPDGNAAIAAVRARLAGTVFEDAPVVPTSVPSGRGLAELRTALVGAFDSTPPPPDVGKARLPVDRVFTLRGVGTVITGTLGGGALGRGQNVVLQPGGRTTRVRSLQSHGRDRPSAGPGTRIALNLPDLSVDGEDAPRRGQVVTFPELGPANDTLDVLLVRTPRLPPGTAPLKNGAAVRFHHGSGSVTARVSLLGANTPLPPGGRTLAQLRLDAPVFAFAGDHFLLRDAAGRATLAGGTVLDPLAARRGFRRSPQTKFLERLAHAAGSLGRTLAAHLWRNHVLPRDALGLRLPSSSGEVAAALDRLAAAGEAALLAGGLAADAAWWQTLRQRAGELVDAEHREHPERPGLTLSQLRAALARERLLPSSPEGLFSALTADLVHHGFARTDATIRRTSHRPALPERLRPTGARLRAALLAHPFEPPSRGTLAPDPTALTALRFLRDSGEVVELNEDIYLLRASFLRMRGAIVRHLQDRGSATASELRQTLGTTRRILVPLLERLDRDGVTRREGDRRTLSFKESV